MKVAVIGSGYVGLVTGACLAEVGHEVVCVDVDENKVRRINEGVPSAHEPGLEELLARNVGRGLRATTESRKAIAAADVSFIAVGTPLDGGRIDLSAVRRAADEIGAALREREGYHVVTVKSTVVPGTTEDVVLPIVERASGKTAAAEFGVAVNPEFLTEGQAVEDFMFPDRIVVGGIDARSIDTVEALYDGFDGAPRLRANPRTAEMIKYVSNALLATAISFSNEIADLCAALGGVDVLDVMRGVHSSRYLTIDVDGRRVEAPLTSFLAAGCGFGGSCLPKDVRALIAHGAERETPMRLLEAVMQVNDGRPDEVVRLLRKHLSRLEGARVAVLGLAFKPDTDDVRDSPALPVVERLVAEGAHVKLHDPVAERAVTSLASELGLTPCARLEHALDDVEAVVLMTRWKHYRALPELLAGRAPQPLVVDGRRMLDKGSLARYEGIGL